ncbi:hypothetical protein WK27_03395 [Burkholderia vietnamiensis]|nr:hypothetical protein WK27_03395 [Burkholderia vietnamiensis]
MELFGARVVRWDDVMLSKLVEQLAATITMATLTIALVLTLSIAIDFTFGCIGDLALAALLHPRAVDQLEKLTENHLQRCHFIARARANEACGLIVWYSGLARVVDIEQARVDAVLEQRQMRRVLQVVADVALVEVHGLPSPSGPVCPTLGRCSNAITAGCITP